MSEVQRKLITSCGETSDAQFGGVTFIQRFGSTHETDDMWCWGHGGGFSIDASVRIDANDREGLERLIRYCARPPFSGQRLRLEDNGNILYIPQKRGPNGRGLMSMTAPELLEKLSHLIPPPHRHRHHYHGVLAPGARLRSRVVALAAQPKITRTDCPEDKPKSSYNWAVLIARIYETLPLVCPCCQGPMRIIAFIEEPDAIIKILSHIGEPTERPVPSPARGPPEWENDFPPDDNTITHEEFPDDVPIVSI